MWRPGMEEEGGMMPRGLTWIRNNAVMPLSASRSMVSCDKRGIRQGRYAQSKQSILHEMTPNDGGIEIKILNWVYLGDTEVAHVKGILLGRL